jgi:hypothetical protein
MKPHECQNEALVIEAVRTGQWGSALRQHIADCESCAEVALAARALNKMRALDEAEARIPDAGLMWWKAQLLAKREAAERATQPINFVERFAYAWAAVCAVGVCVWQWGAIRAWVASLFTRPVKASFASLWDFILRTIPNAVQSWPAKLAYLQGPGLVVVLSVGALVVFVGFAAYLTHSEE